MPAGFGATPGPRQPSAGQPNAVGATTFTRFAVRWLTDVEALAALLPAPLELVGEPVVTFEFSVLANVPWLAGRTYHALSVKLPARFEGAIDHVAGQFCAVIWENLAEPILAGREQLGAPKLFADLPGPRRCGERYLLEASWQGFRFLSLEIDALRAPSSADRATLAADSQSGDGILFHKYVPRTGEPWMASDADYVTFAKLPPRKAGADLDILVGDGTVRIERPSWADMPTQHHIVSALATLPLRSRRTASVIRSTETADFRDQRILA